MLLSHTLIAFSWHRLVFDAHFLPLSLSVRDLEPMRSRILNPRSFGDRESVDVFTKVRLDVGSGVGVLNVRVLQSEPVHRRCQLGFAATLGQFALLEGTELPSFRGLGRLRCFVRVHQVEVLLKLGAGMPLLLGCRMRSSLLLFLVKCVE